MRRFLLGSGVALVAVGALTAGMLPLRSHLSVATTALVLVIPVVAGVAVGGLGAGIFAAAAGFLAYDVLFIPPYNTLAVGAGQNWVALAVYAVVMVVTARVVARLDQARAEAQFRADVTRRLFDLSDLLVADTTLADLLGTIVTTVWQAFDLTTAALLLPTDGHLDVVATAGVALSPRDLQTLTFPAGVPVALEEGNAPDGLQVVALAAAERPIGLLALRGMPTGRASRELLRTFANHLALAMERTQLRDQAVRAQMLEESDRWRRSLMGAVSHDLRTPLATIKVAASSLRDPAAHLSPLDATEMAALIDEQTDRLDRLVANLLDMTRVQTGAFVLRPAPTPVADLVDEAVRALGTSIAGVRLRRDIPADLPLVDADGVLVVQVLTNLIDNAARYSPAGSVVTVSATTLGDAVEVSVTDQGPGVPPAERDTIFEMFNHREAGGRAGLGLAIVKAFVEAHGQTVRVDEAAGGGACFTFSLPVARLDGPPEGDRPTPSWPAPRSVPAR